MPHAAHPKLDAARALVRVLEGELPGPGALATVTAVRGSAPQVVGAKVLRLEDGTFFGTVGGGTVEAKILEACADTLRDGGPRTVTYDLVRDLGMCCGGSMEVFVEHVQAAARLVLIGGGHVAQALAPMAHAAGFRLRVLDDREAMLEHPTFRSSNAETSDHDVDELADGLPDLSTNDYVLVMTRDHRRDETAFAHLLDRPHAYLGMIGSRRKVHRVIERVWQRREALGQHLPDVSRVRAPIGLDLGGRAPAEIAVAILAELLATRHGGSASSMSVVAEAVARVRAAKGPSSGEPAPTG